MKRFASSIAFAAALAGIAALAPLSAVAAGGGHGFSGGGHSFGGGGHSFGGGGWHGGRSGGSFRGGHWGGGHWGHRGFGPGVFWGGLGLGLGVGAISYYGDGYYAPYPYYDGYYDDAPVIVSPGYTVVEPAAGVRSGQPVPQVARAPDPIYYPRNGQSAATTEFDRRECNRWATAQPGAMADGSIFQRATLACMEGRGYTVR
jgi:hypothetical protein